METSNEFGPWNPGIYSQLPREVLKQSSLLRPENIQQSFAEVEEISEFTGLPREDIVAFRPERLMVHELLIRVSADYSVSDGDQYEDLGVNFRQMAQTLLDKYLLPQTDRIVDQYQDLCETIGSQVDAELGQTLFNQQEPEPEEKVGFWQRLRKKPQRVSPPESPEIREAHLLQQWQKKSQQNNEDALQQMLYESIGRICAAIMNRYGRIRGDKDMLVKLIRQQICNQYGSLCIGQWIEPIIAEGAENEGYIKLPAQPQPIIMNVKGSSASGKSTLRPLQHQLAQRLGLRWAEFALISPDIWRKFLLDYESLGENYKYAATCSGHELKIVDQKLDSYMAQKADNNEVPHLLIDRFRFDSFAEKSTEEGSNLLTRFAAKVYMFYMITPPDATVERAWIRGTKVGRYKAVDDLLDHNVEAFTGMPQLFFTWALDRNKDVHYEFLDNSIPLGQKPRTVAFGENGSLTILDIKCMMDIDRYRKININAQSPDTVYPGGTAMDERNNTSFIQQCIKRLDTVVFADFNNSRIAARISKGELIAWNPEVLKNVFANEKASEALLKIFEQADEKAVDSVELLDQPETIRQQTLGQWGGS